MDAALRRRLSEILGSGGVSAGDAIAPVSVEQVIAVVRACAGARARITVRSGAAHATANSSDGDTIVLDVSRLQGLSVESQRLTARAESGVPLDTLRDEVAKAHLAVVGMPGQTASQHAGSLVARGDVPRRALCGVEAVLSTGEHISFGGGVLKDVVGYDIPTVLLGSMGRLAVIVAATFRLEPAGAKTPVTAPPGAMKDGSHELLKRAFDPEGLLPGTS